LTLIQADEALLIAQAVEAVLNEAGAQEAIRRVTKSDMHLSMRQPSQRKDALWELYLLLYFRSLQVPVRMQEPPDLSITLSGALGSYGAPRSSRGPGTRNAVVFMVDAHLG